MKKILKFILWLLLVGILLFLSFGMNKNKANAPDVDTDMGLDIKEWKKHF